MRRMLTGLDRLLENRIRLGVMSLLVVRREVDFNSIKELLGVTDGNLASHTSTLEREGYLRVKKRFIGKKTRTTYMITETGQRVFAEHVHALERLLKGARG